MDPYRLIATHAPDAISVHDLEGRFLWLSPGFRDLLGIDDPDTLVGRDPYELFHPDDVAAVRVSHETIVTLPTSYTLQYRMRTADGTYRWVETSSSTAEEEQVIVSVTRPLDPQRSTLDALEANRLLASRLREFDKQRHHFLTAVAHRARQPLTVTLGVVELLARHWQELEPRRVDELFARTLKATERLQQLVEQVTQAEALAQRTQAVAARPIDVATLVRELVADLTSADHPITLDVPDGSVVFADRDLVTAALRVLLDNATRHTPADTPVWVRLERSSTGTVLIVEDAGPGVDRGRRAMLFGAFTGAEDTPDPGLGLGLHTVAEIASAHQGRAWVEERPGGGASFRLQLPYAPADTIDVTKPSRPRPTIHVLVVDDDPGVAEVLGMGLQGDHYRVRSVDNGTDAIREILRSPPDVVVLDVMMPGLDGREVARTLRANDRTRDIPIVVCSALTSADDRDQAYAAGADAFVAKPFDIDEVLTALARVLARPPSRTE